MSLYDFDKKRYGNYKMPIFQKYFRRYQDSNFFLLKLLYKILFKFFININHVELSVNNSIGKGLYIGHPYCITVNPEAIIGENCNIHKGVTIGKENRGKKRGVPRIGNEVWIGVNSTIVGNISIGNNVLIAPNSFVNCEVPDNSVVFGNPCTIKNKEFATKDYINNKV